MVQFYSAPVAQFLGAIDICTMNGAALALEKHRNTVSRWIKEGRLPIIRLGNTALIPEEAIRALLKDGQFERGRADWEALPNSGDSF